MKSWGHELSWYSPRTGMLISKAKKPGPQCSCCNTWRKKLHRKTSLISAYVEACIWRKWKEQINFAQNFVQWTAVYNSRCGFCEQASSDLHKYQVPFMAILCLICFSLEVMAGTWIVSLFKEGKSIQLLHSVWFKSSYGTCAPSHSFQDTKSEYCTVYVHRKYEKNKIKQPYHEKYRKHMNMYSLTPIAQLNEIMEKQKRPASSPSSTQLHQNPNLQHQQSSISSIHNDGSHWKASI